SIDPQAVRSYLSSCAGVAGVHDLHIWPLSTTENALTAHLVCPSGHPGDEFLAVAASELKQRFGIGHATLQIEIHEQTACHLAPDQGVGGAAPPPRSGSVRSLTSNPLEPTRTELKLAPGFLIRSAPKPRRVVDRVGA